MTPSNASNSIKDIHSCLASVQSWMSANKLKINPDKTEFIVFGNKRQQAELAPFFPADILGNGLVPAVTVKNVGVKLDSCLELSKQVSDPIRACNYHIKDLRRVRAILRSLLPLLCAMHWWEARLTTVIHYIMELLTNKCRRLQGIQNTLCRIVTRTHRFSSVTGPLMSLHWSA